MDIEKMRGKKGWSREDLASRLRVTSQSVWRWEKGKVIPHEVFKEKMRRLFGGFKRNEP